MEDVETIEKFLRDIIADKDFITLTFKSVMVELAEKMNLDESYFICNAERKQRLKEMLGAMISKLSEEGNCAIKIKNERIEANKKKHEIESIVKRSEANDSVTDRNEENRKFPKCQVVESVNKQRGKRKLMEIKDESNENNEKEVDIREKCEKLIKSLNNKKIKLRKIVSDLKIGPRTYTNLKSENDENVCRILQERIVEFCQKKNICSEPNRLPNANEIYKYQKKKKLEAELDGIDPSNIIESSRRSGRNLINYSEYQTSSKLDKKKEENDETNMDNEEEKEQEEEEEEEKNDDDEVVYDEKDFEEEED